MITQRLPGPVADDLAGGLRSKPALRAAATWAEAKLPRFLVLEGLPGSGKTLAAAWAFEHVRDRIRHRGPRLAYDACMRDPWPVWCDARLVCSMVGHEWRHEQAWSDFDCARLVVLDDVGLERDPERMSDLLERLYNVSSGRAILTTNLDFEAFSLRYGERVRSRVVGSAQWVQCADPDMRMRVVDGEPFATPQAPTAIEIAAKTREDAERAREEAEWEAGREARDKMFAAMLGEVAAMAERAKLPIPADSSDAERREVLRQQVERLRERDDEGAVH